MTAQLYEFREILDENEVFGSLISFWEGWCDMNEEEDYQGDSYSGPSFTKVPYQKKSFQKKMVQGWEDRPARSAIKTSTDYSTPGISKILGEFFYE